MKGDHTLVKNQKLKVKQENKLFQLIKSLGNTLLSKQIKLKKITLDFNSSDVVIINKIPFNCNQSFEWKFKLDQNNYYYFNNKWKKIDPEKYFRLPIYNKFYVENHIPLVNRKNLKKKFGYYFSQTDFLKRSYKFFFYQIIPQILFFKNNKKNNYFDKELAFEGGLTFKLTNESKKRIELKCIDYGGIFDKNINTEGLQWPDQVPVDYYSCEYALFIFYWLWKSTNNEKWLNGCLKGLDFFIKNHKPYTTIAFNCYEFKLMPMIQLYNKIKYDKQHFDTKLIRKLKSCFNNSWQTYIPVNVYAMRLANMSLLESIDIPTNKFKKIYSNFIIKSNQSPHGLIADNMGGARIKNIDLTYHQFSLACLCISQLNSESKKILKIIKKAYSFSKSIQLPDGHVSYYGRGTNNIYHLGSYLFSSVFLNQEDKTDFKILDFYKKYYSKKNGLPSALNKNIDKRMGWNHCSVPYNGQLGWLLCNTYDLLGNKRFSSLIENNFYGDEHDFLRLKNDKICAVVIKGSDRYQWSDNSRISGLGGLGALTINDKNVLLSIEYSMSDKLHTSDINIDWKPEYKSFPKGSLKKINELKCIYRIKNHNIEYLLGENSLSTTYTLIYGKENIISPSINIIREYIETYFIDKNKFFITLATGQKIIYQLVEKNHVKGTVTKISSNPFGEGLKFHWEIDNDASSKILKTEIKLIP